MFNDVSANSEQIMVSALAQQPSSPCPSRLRRTSLLFQMWLCGVVTKLCGSQLDHGAFTVGNGSSSGTHC